jgi:hypothetical protein
MMTSKISRIIAPVILLLYLVGRLSHNPIRGVG